MVKEKSDNSNWSHCGCNWHLCICREANDTAGRQFNSVFNDRSQSPGGACFCGERSSFFSTSHWRILRTHYKIMGILQLAKVFQRPSNVHTDSACIYFQRKRKQAGMKTNVYDTSWIFCTRYWSDCPFFIWFSKDQQLDTTQRCATSPIRYRGVTGVIGGRWIGCRNL